MGGDGGLGVEVLEGLRRVQRIAKGLGGMWVDIWGLGFASISSAGHWLF